jgi:uncharacterized membrane protein
MTDRRLDIIIANVLRGGVSLSAAIVVIGGIAYLRQHGNDVADYRTFHGSSTTSASLRIIRLGLLVLIATPIARVALSLVAFAAERDRIFVAIAAIVLVVLLFGIFG